jgi:hypothetical protein
VLLEECAAAAKQLSAESELMLLIADQHPHSFTTVKAGVRLVSWFIRLDLGRLDTHDPTTVLFVLHLIVQLLLCRRSNRARIRNSAQWECDDDSMLVRQTGKKSTVKDGTGVGPSTRAVVHLYI